MTAKIENAAPSTAQTPAEFRLVPAGPPEIGKGQRWEAVVRENGEAGADVFPVVLVHAFSGNAAANLIDMVRVAVRAELNARANAAKAKTATKRKKGT
jgi:hypothetical protein